METAQAEAQFNRIDTFGPDGSGVRHGYTDASGRFVAGAPPKGSQAAQSYTEAPWMRAIRESMQGGASSATNKLIRDNVTNMPGAPKVRDRSDVARDIFDRSFSLIAPAMEKSQERLIANLQARGIPVGGEAFNDAHGEQLRQTQDTIARLGMDANIAAGQEQAREFNLGLTNRNRAMSELAALFGGGFAPTTPVPTGAAPGADISGLTAAQYGAQMDQYNRNQSNRASMGGTLGSLGAAAIMKCSVSYKAVSGPLNEAWAAEVVSQLPLHIWSYAEAQRPEGDHGGKHVGPMAEDFHKLTTLGDGKHIDVVDAVGVLFGALQWAVKAIHAQQAQIGALNVELAAMKTGRLIMPGGTRGH